MESSAEPQRPKLNLKPRSVAADAQADSGVQSSIFGEAKPRERAIAERSGLSEKEVLGELASRDWQLKLRLNAEQREAKNTIEKEIAAMSTELEGGEDPSKEEELRTQIDVKTQELDALMASFEELAMQQAAAGGVRRDRQAEQYQQGYGKGGKGGKGGDGQDFGWNYGNKQGYENDQFGGKGYGKGGYGGGKGGKGDYNGGYQQHYGENRGYFNRNHSGDGGGFNKYQTNYNEGGKGGKGGKGYNRGYNYRHEGGEYQERGGGGFQNYQQSYRAPEEGGQYYEHNGHFEQRGYRNNYDDGKGRKGGKGYDRYDNGKGGGYNNNYRQGYQEGPRSPGNQYDQGGSYSALVAPTFEQEGQFGNGYRNGDGYEERGKGKGKGKGKGNNRRNDYDAGLPQFQQMGDQYGDR